MGDFLIFIPNFIPALLLAVYFFRRQQVDPFEPVTIALSYLAFNTALSAASLWADSSLYIGSDYLRSIGLSKLSYSIAAILESSAFLAFLLGYSVRPWTFGFRIGRYRSAPVSLAKSNAVPLLLVLSLAILGAVGLRDLITSFNIDLTSIHSLSRKRFLDTGDNEFSGAAGYTRWLAQFSQYAALLFLAYAYSRKRRLNLVQLGFSGLLVIMSVLPPFLTSSRFALLSFMLSALVVIHYLRKPFGFKTLGVLGAVAMVSVAMLGELRQLREGGEVNVSVVSALASIADRENAGFLLTAKLVEEMPDAWRHQLGQTYTSWVFAPVPRSIWSDKPAISLGQEVKVILFKRAIERGGGVPPSSAGEMYINFGPLALFLTPVFSFFGGAITKSVYWKLVRNHPTPFSIFVYAVLFLSVLPNFFWTPFSSSVVGLIKALVILFVVHQLLRLFGARRVDAPGFRSMNKIGAPSRY